MPYAYDGDGNLVRTTDRDGRTKVMTYDGLSRETFETWYDASGNLVDTIKNTYDLNDNLLTASNNNGSTVVSFTYDSLNRVTERQNPTGDVGRRKSRGKGDILLFCNIR